jgi:hypothetical protein
MNKEKGKYLFYYQHRKLICFVSLCIPILLLIVLIPIANFLVITKDSKILNENFQLLSLYAIKNFKHLLNLFDKNNNNYQIISLVYAQELSDEKQSMKPFDSLKFDFADEKLVSSATTTIRTSNPDITNSTIQHIQKDNINDLHSININNRQSSSSSNTISVPSNSVNSMSKLTLEKCNDYFISALKNLNNIELEHYIIKSIKREFGSLDTICKLIINGDINHSQFENILYSILFGSSFNGYIETNHVLYHSAPSIASSSKNYFAQEKEINDYSNTYGKFKNEFIKNILETLF